MTTPVIVKQASPLKLLAKALPWLKKTAPKVAPKVVGLPAKAVSTAKPVYGMAEHVGFWAKPHLAMPAVGAGVGAYSSLKRQGKDIQEGKQQKFNWGNLALSAGTGAALGRGAAAIKPVNKLWTKGFTTKALTKGQAKDFARMNPLWEKHTFNKPKLFSKDYFKSVGYDLSHPLESLKAQGMNIRYGYNVKDGIRTIYKRSPIGTAASAAFTVGMPASYAIGQARDKNMSPGEKAVRIGTLGLSYTTPKFLPSMALWSAPDLFFKKKKPQVPNEPTY